METEGYLDLSLHLFFWVQTVKPLPNNIVMSVSCDRLWDIECGACLRVLEGHEELVR